MWVLSGGVGQYEEECPGPITESDELAAAGHQPQLTSPDQMKNAIRWNTAAGDTALQMLTGLIIF